MSRPNEAQRVPELDEPETFGCAANRLEDLLPSKDARAIDAERDIPIARTSSAHARAMGDNWKKVGDKKRRRSAYLVHFGGGPHGSRVDLLSEEGLRLDARDYEEDAERVVHVVLD